MHSGNQYIKEINGSKSIELMELAEKLEHDGKSVINLTGGEPDFDTPEKIVSAAVESLRNGDTHYLVGKGMMQLRERIVSDEATHNSIICNYDNIIMTPGAKFGIYMSVASLINIGDEVIILSPMWVSYVAIVRSCGGNPVVCPLSSDENYEIKKERIAKYITIKTKAIIINYPNNPTGKVLSQKESLELYDIVKKYGLYIISDEIYNRIVFDNKKSVSMASYPELQDKIITVNGFSKSVAMTGWRIGYVIAGKPIIDIMYKLYSHSITGLSPFIQKAAVKAFECDKEIEEMCRIYQERRDYFIKGLNEIEGIKCDMPEGAFYAWTRIERKDKKSDLALELLKKTNILGVPGTAYGAEDGNYMRFSFACKKERLEMALKALQKNF